MFTELDAEQAALNAADAAARAVATAQAQARAAIPGTSATNTQIANTASAQQSKAQPADTDSGGATVYQWLVAWLVVILFGILIARTRIGYALLYYMAALSLLFLILTNYKWIQAAVKPITGDTTTEEPGARRTKNARTPLSEPGAVRT